MQEVNRMMLEEANNSYNYNTLLLNTVSFYWICAVITCFVCLIKFFFSFLFSGSSRVVTFCYSCIWWHGILGRR